MTMTFTLTSEQQAWLESQVTAGAIPSIEDGVHIAISDLMNIAQNDLAWIKPYVDQARASVADGKTIPGDEFLADVRQQISRLKTA